MSTPLFGSPTRGCNISARMTPHTVCSHMGRRPALSEMLVLAKYRSGKVCCAKTWGIGFNMVPAVQPGLPNVGLQHGGGFSPISSRWMGAVSLEVGKGARRTAGQRED